MLIIKDNPVEDRQNSEVSCHDCHGRASSQSKQRELASSPQIQQKQDPRNEPHHPKQSTRTGSIIIILIIVMANQRLSYSGQSRRVFQARIVIAFQTCCFRLFQPSHWKTVYTICIMTSQEVIVLQFCHIWSTRESPFPRVSQTDLSHNSYVVSSFLTSKSCSIL